MPVTQEDLKEGSILIDFDDYQRTDPMHGVRPVNNIPDQPIDEEEEELPAAPSASQEDDQEETDNTNPPLDSETEYDDDDTPEGGDAAPNLYFYIQEELKKDGFIDPEFEFDEKVGGTAVYDAYKQTLEKKLLPVVQEQFRQALLEDGYDPNDLLIARAIRQGVDHRLLSDASRYEIYSNLDETTPDETKAEVISTMYRDSGYKDNDIKILVSAAQQEDNIDELFTQSKEYFGGKFEAFKNAEVTRAAAQREQQKANLRYAEELLNRIGAQQELHGEKLTKIQTKEILDAVRLQTETVEVNGTPLKATELQKFILDFQNDAEFRLHAFKMYKYRDTDKEALKKEAKKEVENDFLAGYAKRVVVSKEGSKNAAIAKEIDKNKNGSKTHRIEW